MRTQAHWRAAHWDADHFISDVTTSVTTNWVYEGVPFANQSLDYIVRNSNNVVITSGTDTTDVNGNLVIIIDAIYLNQTVLVHVENVTTTMNTSGKVHGCQPATVI